MDGGAREVGERGHQARVLGVEETSTLSIAEALKAADALAEDGIAHPVLLGNRLIIEHLAHELGLSLEDIAIEDPYSSPRRDRYATALWERRQRKGLSLAEAHQRLLNPNYFGSMMVALQDADALVSGVNLHYPETIRPALEVIGAHPRAGLVSGLYMLVFQKHVVFCGDTTVNIEPTAEQLEVGIAALTEILRVEAS